MWCLAKSGRGEAGRDKTKEDKENMIPFQDKSSRTLMSVGQLTTVGHQCRWMNDTFKVKSQSPNDDDQHEQNKEKHALVRRVVQLAPQHRHSK
mmetsp:Transcript_15520/g.26926  ORF Transcript_15520/g.26926 Transcript_15520/m.26926 type:complete len:93 (-) Transcript_15520:346-624(-)